MSLCSVVPEVIMQLPALWCEELWKVSACPGCVASSVVRKMGEAADLRPLKGPAWGRT